jgi:hypothetical protein
MRSRRVMPIAILLCLTFVGGADAFDGQRKGFVLGAGLGGGVYTFTQSLDMAKSDRVTEGVITTDVRIGGGLNDEFVLCWHARTSWFGIENALGDEVTIASGVAGLGLLIHPDPELNRWYFSGTLGLSSWGAPLESGVETWWGFGAKLGVGLEFVPHWGIELSLGLGTPDSTEDFLRASTDFYAAELTIVGLAY